MGEKDVISNREGIKIQKDDRIGDPDHIGGLTSTRESYSVPCQRKGGCVGLTDDLSTWWEMWWCSLFYIFDYLCRNKIAENWDKGGVKSLKRVKQFWTIENDD